MDLLREPSILVVVVVSALWYWRGSRRASLRAVGRPRRRAVPWRGLCFGAGLVTIVIALDSSVERLADDPEEPGYRCGAFLLEFGRT